MSSNIVVQVISLILWVFALAGLQINPEQIAGQAGTAITTANWSLFLIVLFNLGNSAYQWAITWKSNRPNFLLFLKSTNWWISACNIAFAALAMKGIHIPAEASEKIVQYVFSGEWWALVGYAIPNIIGPVVKVLTKKPEVQ